NQDLYDLSIDLANEWKIGSQASEQKSLLLLIATDKTNFYALSSGGAARDLPYGLVGVMGRRMRPKFQEGNYSLGLETGLQLFVDILGERSNFTFAALARPRLASSQRASETAAPAVTNAAFRPTENSTPKPARAQLATVSSAAAGSKTDSSSSSLS